MDLYYIFTFICLLLLTTLIAIPLFPKEILIFHFLHSNCRKKVELLVIAKQLTEKLATIKDKSSQKLKLTSCIKPVIYGIILQTTIFSSHYFHIIIMKHEIVNLTLLAIFIVYSGHIIYNLSYLLQTVVFLKLQQSTLNFLEQLKKKERKLRKGLTF